MKIIAKPSVGEFIIAKIMEINGRWETLQRSLEVEGLDAVKKVYENKTRVKMRQIIPLAKVLWVEPVELMTVILANYHPEILKMLDAVMDGYFFSGKPLVIVNRDEFRVVRKPGLKAKKRKQAVAAPKKVPEGL